MRIFREGLSNASPNATNGDRLFGGSHSYCKSGLPLCMFAAVGFMKQVNNRTWRWLRYYWSGQETKHDESRPRSRASLLA